MGPLTMDNLTFNMNKRITLGIGAARHDGSACIYEDYKLLAAVQLERIDQRSFIQHI